MNRASYTLLLAGALSACTKPNPLFLDTAGGVSDGGTEAGTVGSGSSTSTPTTTPTTGDTDTSSTGDTSTTGDTDTGTSTGTTTETTGGSEVVGKSVSQTVNGGTVASSDNFRMVFTLGQPTANQGTYKSASFRLQGGLVGANGSPP